MNLIIFDIDGTIIDSVRTDDECFIRSFLDLFNINLSGADWNNFEHVTDSGLTSEIFNIYLGRSPMEQELRQLKAHFRNLINQRKNEFVEIRGAKNTMAYLIENPEFSIAFATGGWRETARLKLSTVGFEPGKLILTSANDHFDRSVITKMAIDKALKKENLKEFDTITYIGDGIWDLKTSQQLGINFIGIDYHNTRKLTLAGAAYVMNSLNDPEQLIRWATTQQATNGI